VGRIVVVKAFGQQDPIQKPSQPKNENSNKCPTHNYLKLTLYQWPYSNMSGFGAVPWIHDRTLAEEYLNDHYPEVKLYMIERLVSPSRQVLC
jgi:hypothetical protein